MHNIAAVNLHYSISVTWCVRLC